MQGPVLHVRVVEARNLRTTQMFGSQDPYVQLAYRVIPWKTVVGEAPDSPFEATEPEDANAPAPRPTAAASAAPSSRPSAAPSARPSTPRPSQDSKSHTVWCTAHPEKCDGDDTASYG